MYTHIFLPLPLPPSPLYHRKKTVWSGLAWTEEIVLLKIPKRADVMQWLGCLKWGYRDSGTNLHSKKPTVLD